MLLEATMEGEKGEALYQHKLGDTCKIPVVFLFSTRDLTTL